MPGRVTGPGTRRWCSVLAAVIGVLVASASAFSGAAPLAVVTRSEPPRLDWSAPAGCPTAGEVRARLSDAVPVEHGSLTVEAVVELETTAGLRASVVLRGSWGETTRTLHSPTCETLAEAVVLLAAVSVDEAQRASAEMVVPEPAPEPEAEPEPEPEPEPSAPGADDEWPGEDGNPTTTPSLSSEPAEPGRRDVQSQSSVQGLLRLDLHAGIGALPVRDLGAGLSIGTQGRWWRAELGGVAWLPTRAPIAADATADFRLWTGHARACGGGALPSASWFAVLGCGGIELGALWGRGRGAGIRGRGPATRAWAGATVGPVAIVRPWNRVGFVLGAQAVVPLRRLRFTVDGDTAVHEPVVVGARGLLGAEVYFP